MSQKINPPAFMESFLIHGEDVTPRWEYGHHVVPPMTASVIYRMDSVERGGKAFTNFGNYEAMREDPVYIYERIDEPTAGMLEDRLAMAEKGEMGIAFSTGMAAISALVNALTVVGDHIISNNSVYGCTYSLFTNWMPKQGVEVSFVALKDKPVASVVRETTRFVYFETPINPTLELIDIQDICAQVAAINKTRPENRQILVVVDNTFASPVCQRPIELGADFSVASLTKHLSGFGTDMGGIVVGPKKYYQDLMVYRKDFGGVLSGRHAWPFLVYGLPSLSIRLERTMKTADTLARYLLNHPKIAKVNFPGLENHPQYALAQKQMTSYSGAFAPSSLIYFVLKGSPAEAKERGILLMNDLAKNSHNYTLAVSLGHCKTLVEHPSSMTHSALAMEDQGKAGIEPGGVRVACGLEEADALIADMAKALDKINM